MTVSARPRGSTAFLSWQQLLGALAALAFAAPIIWRHVRTELTVVLGPVPDSPLVSRLHTELTLLENQLRMSTSIIQPQNSERESHDFLLFSRSIELAVPPFMWLRHQAELREDHPAEERLQALPLVALTVASQQRERIVKLFQQEEGLMGAWLLAVARNPGKNISKASLEPLRHTMPEEVEEYAAPFMLKPLQLLLVSKTFNLLRPLPLPHAPATRRSVVEWAVQKGLRSAVSMLLPKAKGRCDAKMLTTLKSRPGHLSALRLAQINEDDVVEAMLRRDANPCLIFGALPETPKPVAVPHDPNPVLSPATWSSGGWRPSPEHSPSFPLIPAMPSRGCPFPRIPIGSLSDARFAEMYEQGQPLFITGVVEAWPAMRLFTRDHLMTSSVRDAKFLLGRLAFNKSMSRPLPAHKSMRIVTGESREGVRMSTFIEQMDAAHLSDQAGLEGRNTTQAEPWAIFDKFALKKLQWMEGNMTAAYSFPSVVRNSLEQPAATEKRGRKSFFYLGPAEAAAPWHFHCPALNGLVYGAKRWWLQPPSRAIYTQGHPVGWAQDPSIDLPPPYSCVQQAGDLMFIPARWSHAVVNLKESIGVAVEFDVGDGSCDWGTVK